MKQVVRNPDVTAVSDNDVTLSNKRDEDSSVQQKIRCLQAEVNVYLLKLTILLIF